MNTLDERLYARLNGDSTLQGLLGGAGRIRHTSESELAEAPMITFNEEGAEPGSIYGDQAKTISVRYRISVYADNNGAIIARIKRLLAGQHFAPTSEAGSINVEWEGDGPDLYDEPLSVERKDTRFVIHLAPVGLAQI